MKEKCLFPLFALVTQSLHIIMHMYMYMYTELFNLLNECPDLFVYHFCICEIRVSDTLGV